MLQAYSNNPVAIYFLCSKINAGFLLRTRMARWSGEQTDWWVKPTILKSLCAGNTRHLYYERGSNYFSIVKIIKSKVYDIYQDCYTANI